MKGSCACCASTKSIPPAPNKAGALPDVPACKDCAPGAKASPEDLEKAATAAATNAGASAAEAKDKLEAGDLPGAAKSADTAATMAGQAAEQKKMAVKLRADAGSAKNETAPESGASSESSGEGSGAAAAK